MVGARGSSKGTGEGVCAVCREARPLGKLVLETGALHLVGSRRDRLEEWRECKLGPLLVERAATRCLVGEGAGQAGREFISGSPSWT